MRLWVSVVAGAGLLACTLSLALIGAADLSPDERDHLGNVAAWAQIVGVAVAVPSLVFLLRDQRRIADDVRKRPDLRIGLTPCVVEQGKIVREPSRVAHVVANFRGEHPRSEVIGVTIYSTNAGRRSARDLLFNFSFPLDVEVDAEDMADAEGRKARVLVTPERRRAVVVTAQFIHPSDTTGADIGIRVPRGKNDG